MIDVLKKDVGELSKDIREVKVKVIEEDQKAVVEMRAGPWQLIETERRKIYGHKQKQIKLREKLDQSKKEERECVKRINQIKKLYKLS